jgi:hypothetical protein
LWHEISSNARTFLGELADSRRSYSSTTNLHWLRDTTTNRFLSEEKEKEVEAREISGLLRRRDYWTGIVLNPL